MRSKDRYVVENTQGRVAISDGHKTYKPYAKRVSREGNQTTMRSIEMTPQVLGMLSDMNKRGLSFGYAVGYDDALQTVEALKLRNRIKAALGWVASKFARVANDLVDVNIERSFRDSRLR